MLTIALSLLAGCGTTTGSPGHGASPTTTFDPSAGIQVPLMTPTPGLDRLRAIGMNSFSSAGSMLTLFSAGFGSPGSGCSILGRVDVVETTSTVTVTMFFGLDPTAMGSTGLYCDNVGHLAATVVTLSAPLGGRALIDGADHRRVPAATGSTDAPPRAPAP